MTELTILMPCLNEAETLAACIVKARGYLERTGVEGEIVIADNGSTDGSQAIAEALGARVVPVPGGIRIVVKKVERFVPAQPHLETRVDHHLYHRTQTLWPSVGWSERMV